MLPRASSALAIGLLTLHVSGSAGETTYPTCESFGVDFQSGGTYFQNISSTDDFTFTSMFESKHSSHVERHIADSRQTAKMTTRITFWWIQMVTNINALILHWCRTIQTRCRHARYRKTKCGAGRGLF